MYVTEYQWCLYSLIYISHLYKAKKLYVQSVLYVCIWESVKIDCTSITQIVWYAVSGNSLA